MSAKGRHLERFVALGSLRKIPGPPESCYELIIIDENEHPIFYLSELYSAEP
jgi:hypothetical protein